MKPSYFCFSWSTTSSKFPSVANLSLITAAKGASHLWLNKLLLFYLFFADPPSEINPSADVDYLFGGSSGASQTQTPAKGKGVKWFACLHLCAEINERQTADGPFLPQPVSHSLSTPSVDLI